MSEEGLVAARTRLLDILDLDSRQVAALGPITCVLKSSGVLPFYFE